MQSQRNNLIKFTQYDHETKKRAHEAQIVMTRAKENPKLIHGGPSLSRINSTFYNLFIGFFFWGGGRGWVE